MLFGLINRVSSASSLKETLDVSAQRTRGIAQRVANAATPAGTGFALPPNADPAAAAAGQVNLEAEMTSLADEQLRYETAAKLLERTYTTLRTAIRDRA